MLRHIISRINDLMEHRISKITQASLNNGPRLSFVVGFEILDVFKNQHPGTANRDDITNSKEQVSLFLTVETVSLPETEFLGYPGDRKWLTGKTGSQHIMLRNIFRANLIDIAHWHVTEPFFVRHRRKTITFRRKHTLAAQPLQAQPETADPRKQVDEGKRMIHDW